MPPPAFGALIALVAGGVIILVRPAVTGWWVGGVCTAAVICITAGAVVVHGRYAVRHEEVGSFVEAAILPGAALGSLAVAATGTDVAAVGAIALVVCAVIVGLVPHLDAMRLAGRDSPWLRVGLDVSGIVAMVPVALAGASATAWGARLMLLIAGGGALAFDALRLENRSRPGRARGAAVIVGAAVAIATPLAAHAATQAVGAAALLLLWYGGRGVAASLLAPVWRRGPLVEYAAFICVAIAVLVAGVAPGQAA